MVEKKVKSQKALIMAQSSILFWDKGYAETSMKDISKACGFRPANIYNFFKSKESILYEILLDEMVEILSPIKHLEKDESVPPEKALRLVIENLLRLTLSAKRISKLLFDVALKNLSPPHRLKIIRLRDEFDKITIAIIRRGIRDGVFGDIDEKLAAFSIASMIVRARIWYSPRGKYKVDELVDFIYYFVLNGLGSAGTAVQKLKRAGNP
jgi:AcrR family transcriptional regulator